MVKIQKNSKTRKFPNIIKRAKHFCGHPYSLKFFFFFTSKYLTRNLRQRRFCCWEMKSHFKTDQSQTKTIDIIANFVTRSWLSMLNREFLESFPLYRNRVYSRILHLDHQWSNFLFSTEANAVSGRLDKLERELRNINLLHSLPRLGLFAFNDDEMSISLNGIYLHIA